MLSYLIFPITRKPEKLTRKAQIPDKPIQKIASWVHSYSKIPGGSTNGEIKAWTIIAYGKTALIKESVEHLYFRNKRPQWTLYPAASGTHIDAKKKTLR